MSAMPGVWDGKEGLLILCWTIFLLSAAIALLAALVLNSQAERLDDRIWLCYGTRVWICPCFCQETPLIPPQTPEMWLMWSGSRPRS